MAPNQLVNKKKSVKDDLGLKSLAAVHVQQLTPLQRPKRLKMTQSLLNELKLCPTPPWGMVQMEMAVELVNLGSSNLVW